MSRSSPTARSGRVNTLHRCAGAGVAPRRLTLEVAGEAGRVWCRGAWVEPTNHEAEALRAVSALWDAIAAKAREAPLRFSVVASHLTEWPPRQGELFERTGAGVQGALNTVRRRFGARAVTLGDSLDRSGRYTGLKISFEHIPEVADFAWLGIDVPTVGGDVHKRLHSEEPRRQSGKMETRKTRWGSSPSNYADSAFGRPRGNEHNERGSVIRERATHGTPLQPENCARRTTANRRWPQRRLRQATMVQNGHKW